jgi:hypothetical protein
MITMIAKVPSKTAGRKFAPPKLDDPHGTAGPEM